MIRIWPCLDIAYCGFDVRLVDRYVEGRRRALKGLEKLLSEAEVERARRDWHAGRKPRPCGLTVHTGVGCRGACIYCYIYDMGFGPGVRSYPLRPEALAYSIASNPYVLVGEWGTFLALGSVTEPFLEETRDYTIALLSVLRRYLGCPAQLSTKWTLSDEDIGRLARSDPLISILYTIVTIDLCRVLEPGAPTAEERLQTAGEMVRRGLRVSLFVRPVIPGVTDVEAGKILDAAADAGIRSVVVGTLRVTRRIYDRLSSIPPVREELRGRVDASRLSRRQVAIRGGDLKRMVVNAARERGFKVYPSACAANVDHHGQYCNMCSYGPCGNAKPPYSPSEDEVRELMEYLGLKGEVWADDYSIEVRLRGRIDGEKVEMLRLVTAYGYRVPVKVAGGERRMRTC